MTLMSCGMTGHEFGDGRVHCGCGTGPTTQERQIGPLRGVTGSPVVPGHRGDAVVRRGAVNDSAIGAVNDSEIGRGAANGRVNKRSACNRDVMNGGRPTTTPSARRMAMTGTGANHSAANHSAANHSAANRSAANHSAANRSAANHVAANRSAANRSAANRRAADHVAAGRVLTAAPRNPWRSR